MTSQSNGFKAPPPSGWDAVVRRIADIERRLRAVERPSGTQIAQLLAQVQTELANIDATVAASIAAQSYTKTQIDNKVANPGNISPGNVSASGSVTAAGNITASGNVSGNAGTFNGGLTSTAVYGTTISGTRTATWTQNDGTMGTAPSALHFKTDLTDAGLVERAPAILGIAVRHYHYLAEIAKRDDPNSPNYVGPEYKVHDEVGMIAEDLHAAGLWEFVIYERENVMYDKTETVVVMEPRPVTTLPPVVDVVVSDVPVDVQPVTEQVIVQAIGEAALKLDEKGQPIPLGIHYELFSMAVLAVCQWQQIEIDGLKARLDAAGL